MKFDHFQRTVMKFDHFKRTVMKFDTGMKKGKKYLPTLANTSSRDGILQCFYYIFYACMLNIICNFNMFEHNKSKKKDIIGPFYKN